MPGEASLPRVRAREPDRPRGVGRNVRAATPTHPQEAQDRRTSAGLIDPRTLEPPCPRRGGSLASSSVSSRLAVDGSRSTVLGRRPGGSQALDSSSSFEPSLAPFSNSLLAEPSERASL